MNVVAPSGTPRALYVATDLAGFEPEDTDLYAPDIVIQGRPYRSLDPAYYAWLRHRLGLVEKAKDNGRILPPAYEALVRRFHTAHVWAVEHLGQDALDAAIDRLEPSAYTPPIDPEASPLPYQRQVHSPAPHTTPARHTGRAGSKSGGFPAPKVRGGTVRRASRPT